MARRLSVAVGCCALTALVLGATAGAAPPSKRVGASVVVVERLPTLLHNEHVRGAELAAAGSPIALLNGTVLSGYPLAGSGPTGETVRFIDRGTFWVAVLVRNRSATQTVTIVDARTPEPLRSLVAQTSARFSRHKPCPGGSMLCGYPSSRTSTAPLTLAPGGMAAVKLSYRLASCALAAVSTTASATTLVVSYRSGNGPAREQAFPLGGASLRLQRPAGVECLARPYSHIGLVGSFTTSPGHKPIPGSDGDTCTKTAGGGLAYRSRLFMDRSGTMFRIAINLLHYRGKGSYQPAGSPGETLGLAQVVATGGFGLHGWTTFRDNASTVTVATASGTTLGGRFTAVFSGHRRFFRAYGAWRCTMLR